VSRLTLEDIKAISRVNPSIAHVDGNVQGAVHVVYGDKNATIQGTGALPVYEDMRNAHPYYGRFYTDAENALEARVCLLGQTVINNLFGKENPVAKEIKVNQISCRVIV